MNNSQSRSTALEIIASSTDRRDIDRACYQRCNILEHDGVATIYTFADGSRIRVDRDSAAPLPSMTATPQQTRTPDMSPPTPHNISVAIALKSMRPAEPANTEATPDIQVWRQWCADCCAVGAALGCYGSELDEFLRECGVMSSSQSA